jgi:hypothetical protein
VVDGLAHWIWSGQLVDIIIGLTLIEAVFLVAYHRITQRGLAPKDYALNLAAGLFLMLALRAALAHSSWIWIAASLTASGLAHIADMLLRWRRQG